MRTWLAAAVLATCVLDLTGCATVDDFKDRIARENRQTKELLDEETLLNVVRASRYEPLNFIAISQVSGTRMEDLKVGLPTLTIGPKQTSTQHQWVFSGNVVDSQAQATFQSNPLISTAFQQGMLTPISSHTLAMLAATHGREPVFLATTDEIEVHVQPMKKTDHPTRYSEDGSSFFDVNGKAQDYFFRNDPDPGALDAGCSVTDFAPDKSTDAEAFLSDDIYINEVLLKVTKGPDTRVCNAARFKALLKGLLYVGLTLDIPETAKSTPAATGGGVVGVNRPTVGSGGGSGAKGNKESDTATEAVGRFCVDSQLVERDIADPAGNDPRFGVIAAFPLCLVNNDASDSGAHSAQGGGDLGANTEPKKLEHYYYLNDEKSKALRMIVTIRPRSPIGVYQYLGAVMRNGGNTDLVSLSTADARRRFGVDPGRSFFKIVESDDSDCDVTADVASKTYCVRKDDISTRNLLSLVQDMRNLNIQPSDLNAAFSVRVTQ